MSSNGKEFSVEPILAVVAATRTPRASAPCKLDPLMELIGYVLGQRSVGPSVIGPAFIRENVLTGLVLLRQSPRLVQVKFLRTASLDGSVDEAVYQRWLARERAALSLPATLSVLPATSNDLRAVSQQVSQIIEATMRALRRA